MICRESSKLLGLTECKNYDIETNGEYKVICNDRNEFTALTKEQFNLYFADGLVLKKVVCESDEYEAMTEGKEYTTLPQMRGYTNCYVIIDDQGYTDLFNKDNFKEVEND